MTVILNPNARMLGYWDHGGFDTVNCDSDLDGYGGTSKACGSQIE